MDAAKESQTGSLPTLDYDQVGFPATDLRHTAGPVKALLLLELSKNKSALQVGRERHLILIHVTDGIKQRNQAGCFHELSCKDLLSEQAFLAEKGLAGHLVTYGWRDVQLAPLSVKGHFSFQPKSSHRNLSWADLPYRSKSLSFIKPPMHRPKVRTGVRQRAISSICHWSHPCSLQCSSRLGQWASPLTPSSFHNATLTS